MIELSSLPEELLATDPLEAQENAASDRLSNGVRLEDLERQAILAAIANAKGNMSQAARALGISRSTLYVKLGALRERIDLHAHRH